MSINCFIFALQKYNYKSNFCFLMRIISLFIAFLYAVLSFQFKLMAQEVRTGADRIEEYLPLLQGKRVGLVVNHTSVISASDGSLVPLPDSLIHRGVNVRCIMAPEHGYEGVADAGEHLSDQNDVSTGLKIYSLYGNTRKPQKEWMEDIDILIFDMQDVGARFYTYLSTMKNVIEACGEEDKELMILDRPNPNDTIDGPVLDMKFTSFVGALPIPLLHGCTLGELAKMIVGESWAEIAKPLIVVPCVNWKHGQDYDCPIAPSPNLPNSHAIRLYPSLCLFEGTGVSVGRGTEFPFEVYGHPAMKGSFSFVPKPSASNKSPLQNGKKCNGEDLREVFLGPGFNLAFLQNARQQLGNALVTSQSFFDRLAGTDVFRKQLLSGKSEQEIRDSWQIELEKYKEMRMKYLLYR